MLFYNMSTRTMRSVTRALKKDTKGEDVKSVVKKKAVVKMELESTIQDSLRYPLKNKEKVKEEVKTEVDTDKPEMKKRKKNVSGDESEEQRVLRETVGAKVLQAAGNSKKFLGVHVSAAGSLEQAIHNARAIGCRAFALFVRNGRTWNHKPMEDNVVDRWNRVIEETGYPLDKILPHGSYLLNPGSPDAEKLRKSREGMLDECLRAEKLGIGLYNFHPGSTTGDCTVEECCKTVGETINYIHENTKNIVLVIETMAKQGHTVGGTFKEIAQMISHVELKERVGVCIDTCHVFAAGYEFNTVSGYNAMMAEFEEEIGFEYLKGFHVNDSKDICNNHKDRHELIGKGHIGLEGFRCMMNDPRLNDIPMILETPDTGENYPKEMIMLHNLESSGQDIDDKKKMKEKTNKRQNHITKKTKQSVE